MATAAEKAAQRKAVAEEKKRLEAEEAAAEAARLAAQPATTPEAPIEEDETPVNTATTAPPAALNDALPTAASFPHRVPLNVSPEQYERLRRLRYETGVSGAELIRAALDSRDDAWFFKRFGRKVK